MHGTVDRLDDLVISTDDYELFRSKRGAFLPILQSHLSSFSMLFLGLSFTDPNLRHVLSLIRESFVEAPPEHFAIVRPPHAEEFLTNDEFEARLAQHNLWADDLQRYGLRAVEIDSYGEVPELLKEVEQRLARRRVWVSGSWPIGAHGDVSAETIHTLAYGIGREIGKAELVLVSGSGLLVGSAVLSGFLAALQNSGAWDLERRLIVRPFPQPLPEHEPDREQWQLLRRELGRISGIAIFIGGQKVEGGRLVESSGVHAERAVAEEHGAFLLPIGATGGAARSIANDLLGRPLRAGRPLSPTDEELCALLDTSRSPSDLISITIRIVKRVVDS